MQKLKLISIVFALTHNADTVYVFRSFKFPLTAMISIHTTALFTSNITPTPPSSNGNNIFIINIIMVLVIAKRRKTNIGDKYIVNHKRDGICSVIWFSFDLFLCFCLSVQKSVTYGNNDDTPTPNYDNSVTKMLSSEQKMRATFSPALIPVRQTSIFGSLRTFAPDTMHRKYHSTKCLNHNDDWTVLCVQKGSSNQIIELKKIQEIHNLPRHAYIWTILTQCRKIKGMLSKAFWQFATPIDRGAARCVSCQ